MTVTKFIRDIHERNATSGIFFNFFGPLVVDLGAFSFLGARVKLGGKILPLKISWSFLSWSLAISWAIFFQDQAVSGLFLFLVSGSAVLTLSLSWAVLNRPA